VSLLLLLRLPVLSQKYAEVRTGHAGKTRTCMLMLWFSTRIIRWDRLGSSRPYFDYRHIAVIEFVLHILRVGYIIFANRWCIRKRRWCRRRRLWRCCCCCCLRSWPRWDRRWRRRRRRSQQLEPGHPQPNGFHTACKKRNVDFVSAAPTALVTALVDGDALTTWNSPIRWRKSRWTPEDVWIILFLLCLALFM